MHTLLANISSRERVGSQAVVYIVLGDRSWITNFHTVIPFENDVESVT